MIQAVILAAGKSTRTYPLTINKPKPLLPILNKEIIFHTLDSIKNLVNEVIIIVGYKKELIKGLCKNKYKNINIKYVDQDKPLGTGDAILKAKPFLNNRFLVLNGDDLYSEKDIKSMFKYKYCILTKEVDTPSLYGIITTSYNNIVKEIVEKPKNPRFNLANSGVYLLDKEIFSHKLKKSSRGEYEITDYIHYLVKKKLMKYEKIKNYWIPICYPWNLLDATEFFINKIDKKIINGKIERRVTIKGKVIIGKGTIVKSGAYIEGPVFIGKNCVIGPNCYIRKGTVIGNNSKVGNACEIKNTILMNKVSVGHLSYIGDSVIGDYVNLGAGTITANLRHDNNNIKSIIKENLINSNRRKLGTIIGDYVHTGINTSIYPGRKLWSNTSTLPGEIITKDKIL
jgi:UDP-N-acetylglucosamine diphosphorylase / glucose-1-phosphate thymidylyltransferase / UDP-N-acetylgalactosamine diphosphorylase / glucosamine-1-phosphate N-acetyltransferase / galactosamine-1-phosphate N-acetyltransferase